MCVFMCVLCVCMCVCVLCVCCVCVCVSCFHCQTAGPIKQKFGMWSPSSSLSAINHMCVWKWVWFITATPTKYLGCQKLIKRSIRVKFGMWSPSNCVSINYEWVW